MNNGTGILLLNQEHSAIQEAKFIDSKNASALFSRHSFCIEIDPDRGRLASFMQDPYIKLGESNSSIRQSKYILRICLIDARVIYHKGPSIKITNRLLEDLNLAMQYTSINKSFPGTVLQSINSYLKYISMQNNISYNEITNVDFTKAYNYRNNNGDYKLC